MIGLTESLQPLKWKQIEKIKDVLRLGKNTIKNVLREVFPLIHVRDFNMNTLKAIEPGPTRALKKFEMCFDHEPTIGDIDCLKNEANAWRRLRVIRAHIQAPVKTKMYKFWTLSFDVDESDWQFWCGFLSGRKWRKNVMTREAQLKDREKNIVDYQVQI